MGKEDYLKVIQQRNVTINLTDEIVDELFNQKGAKTIEDLYFEIGKNTISPNSAVNWLLGEEKTSDYDLIESINRNVYIDKKSDSNVVVEGLDNPSIKLSNCCSPIPGDRITGYISKGVGIAVHRTRCNNLQKLDKNRYIDVLWGNDRKKTYPVNIKLIVSNRDNVLAEIINSITSTRGKVLQVMASTNKREEGVIKIKLEVHNKEELENIILNLKKINSIYSIERLMK